MVQELRVLKATGLKRTDWEKKAATILRRHNRTWLKAELQATTASAQAAESWQHFQRRAYLYPNLKYVTAGDERVRQSHRVLDGIVRPVNDLFWNTHTPPLGWGCRCKLIQVDEPVTEAPDLGDLKIAKGFDQNPGKTFKLFGDNHPYFNVSALDREAIETLAKGFHAEITKNQVRRWAQTDLAFDLQGIQQPVTATSAEVVDITAGSHIDEPGRNELLYVLQSLEPSNISYAGRFVPTETSEVLQWLYYLVKANDQQYYLNVAQIAIEGQATRYGLKQITDNLPNGP
jgi:SPP1 gp7 family putative phage head morphogenesis protein